MTSRIVSIINPKGRVGKSTLIMVLAEFLVFKYRKRVLLIDMDAQGNLSDSIVPAAQIKTQESTGRTAYHLMKMTIEGNNIDLSQFITCPPLIVSNIARSSTMNCPGVFDMIISLPAVAELEENLLKLWEDGKPIPSGLRINLAKTLKTAKDNYDYVLIDCPSGLSQFSSAALIASDYYISPIIPEPLSLQGVDLVQRRSRELNERYKCKLQFKGVILNIVNTHRNKHLRIADDIYSSGRELYQPFRFWLPDNLRLRSIGEFDPYLPGTWSGGLIDNFATLNEKYSLSFTLTNPTAGSLNCSHIEGSHYRLEDRICRLVEEFQERCQ